MLQVVEMVATGPAPLESTIDRLLAKSRKHLNRVAPSELATELDDGAVLVDIRPAEQRTRDGEMPEAVVIDRNVLEWRVDPTSPWRLPVFADPDVRIIVLCNQGYASSLAAAVLQKLGLTHATDLVGGFQAWSAWIKDQDRGRWVPGNHGRA